MCIAFIVNKKLIGQMARRDFRGRVNAGKKEDGVRGVSSQMERMQGMQER